MRTFLGSCLILVAATVPAQRAISPLYRVTTAVDAGLTEPTTLAEDASGRIYASQFGGSSGNGQIGVVSPTSTSASVFANRPQLFNPAGIVVRGNQVWITHRGSSLQDESPVIVYTDLDHSGSIQSNDEYKSVQFASSIPSGFRTLARGRDGLLYVAQGGTTYTGIGETVGLGRRNASVWRFDPTDETPSASVLAYGFCWPRGLIEGASNEFFVTDLAPGGAGPDELNLIQPGRYYGFGEAPGQQPIPPWVSFPPFSSPAGVAYFEPCEFTRQKETLFVAMGGNPAGLPEPPPKIIAIEIVRDATGISAVTSDFATGFESSYGLLKSRDALGRDALLVSDHKAGKIYMIRLRTESDPPDLDLDGDHFVGPSDLLSLIHEWVERKPNLADFDGKDGVNSRDLFIFSSGWYTNVE